MVLIRCGYSCYNVVFYLPKIKACLCEFTTLLSLCTGTIGTFLRFDP